MKSMLGKKAGMTQIFDESGEVVPVTVIEVGPCYVTQIKTPEQDGYRAVQIGFEEVNKPKRLTKGQKGHLQKRGLPLLRHLREVLVREDEEYEEEHKHMFG